MTDADHEKVSTMTLDVYWASGRSGDAALDAHIAGCPRCRAYLDGLAALEEPAAPPVPAWLRAAPVRPVRTRWRRAAMAAGGALALAASVVAWVRVRPAPEGYVGVKGTPGVGVLVHRDHDTQVWDERTPVRPGDALALRVACEGLRRVTVAAPGPAGWTRLSETPCPAEGATLPFTLTVDAEPGDEHLAVVLSVDPMDDRALREAIEGTRRTREVWTVKLVLPKSTEPGR